MKSFIILYKKDGIVQNLKALANFLSSIKDGKILLEASPINKRSSPQNRYYWQILTVYIQPALLDAGWERITTKEAAHEFVSEMFLTIKEVNEKTGEMKPYTKSTTELTKEEFGTYLEDIWRWSAEYLSIAIPSPGEKLLINYE